MLLEVADDQSSGLSSLGLVAVPPGTGGGAVHCPASLAVSWTEWTA